MLEKNIWEQSEWTKLAYQLLKGINQLPKENKLIMVIRHSHRYDSKNIRDHPKDLLTPIGHKFAEFFGEHLPKDRPIRLYYSKIERCKQTAVSIFNGYNHSPNSAEIIGPLNILYDIDISPEDFYREATKYPLEQLVHRWVAGLYPSDMIPPIQEYAKKSADIIWNEVEKGSKKCIDIHVTHDLILSILRLGWFGLPIDKWPSYLSGFVFTLQGNDILLFDFDHLKLVEAPFWWKNKTI